MDTHFGMSMAKVFDPGTSIQMSVSGTFLNILFLLYIFCTDSHLLLIRIFADSFQVLPAGAFSPAAWTTSF
jgi:flagellar biosynthetic protein FliR